MPHEPQTIYDLLVGQTVGEATLENLDSASAKTFLEHQTLEYWQGIMTIAQIVKASRCYSHGLSIPEQSVMLNEAVPPGEHMDIQPPGTELWNIIAIAVTSAAGTPVVTVNAFDGFTPAEMHSASASTTAASYFPWESPIPVTNSGYMRVSNTDLANAVSVQVMYHKVGL